MNASLRAKDVVVSKFKSTRDVFQIRVKVIVLGLVFLGLFLGFTFTANERLYGDISFGYFLLAFIFALLAGVTLYFFVSVLVEYRIAKDRKKIATLVPNLQDDPPAKLVDVERQARDIPSLVMIAYMVLAIGWYQLVMSKASQNEIWLGVVIYLLFGVAAFFVLTHVFVWQSFVMKKEFVENLNPQE